MAFCKCTDFSRENLYLICTSSQYLRYFPYIWGNDGTCCYLNALNATYFNLNRLQHSPAKNLRAVRQGIHRMDDRHAVLFPSMQQSGVQRPHPKRDSRENQGRNYPNQNQRNQGDSGAGCTDRIGGRLFTAYGVPTGGGRYDQKCELGPAAHAHQTLRGGFVPVVPGKTRPARERIRHFRMLHRRRSSVNVWHIGQNPPRHRKAELHPEVSAGQVHLHSQRTVE